MKLELKQEDYKLNWDNLVKQTSESFRLTENEIKLLKKSRIAMLIGALPYIAECIEPERTSLVHLSTYLIAMKGSKEAFFHNLNDDKDILNRLVEINTFNGGNPEIIEKGMKLLALNMVHDYKRDIEEDKANNKYNSISSGSWNYTELVEKLTNDIHNIRSPQIDNYFKTVDTPFMYWFGW